MDKELSIKDEIDFDKFGIEFDQVHVGRFGGDCGEVVFGIEETVENKGQR